MTEPQTEAGRALLRRGSNNWTGSDWQLTFAANIAAIEAEARDAALAEYKARLDRAEAVVAAARKVKLDWDDLSRPTDLVPLLAALRAYEDADKVADG